MAWCYHFQTNPASRALHVLWVGHGSTGKQQEESVPIRATTMAGSRCRKLLCQGIVLHRATVLEEVRLIVAPDHLEAVEDTLCHVEVRVVNRGMSLATVRFAIAHEAPKIVDISKGEASYAVALAMTLELRMSLIVEAKGSDGTFAPVQGGTSDPITVTPRQDKVAFGSALDVFDDLDDQG